MILHRLEVGPLAANCYLIGDERTRQGLIVDPGGDAPDIMAAVSRTGLNVRFIVDTHGHPDHVSANEAVRRALTQIQADPPKLLVHEADRAAVEQPPMQWLLIGMRPAPCPVDDTLTEGQVLQVGGLSVRVMHLPGHSPGSIALVVEDAVFTGDTLFEGSIGRTDLPGGDLRQIMASLKRLVTELPPETRVYPGHGLDTSIARELTHNEWLEGLG